MKPGRMRALLIGALAIAAACGADAGEVMRDAGDAIADAGRWLADAGQKGESDASAQAPGASVHEVACGAMYEWTVQQTSAKTRQARLYAELDVDTEGVVAVSEAGISAQLDSGKVRVLCGAGSAVGDAPVTWIYRWERARIALHR